MADQVKKFGRFEMKRSLGKGSFGEVWLAHDPNLNRDVAVKILHQGLTADLKFIQVALREAQLVGKVDHPNVVKILEVGEVSSWVFIEMEYIDGRPLSQLLQSGRKPTFSQSLVIIEQLASALDATHAQKIIHRDVKPANVMVDSRGNVHLVDFGLAHAALASLGPSSDLVGIGTAMYMSPEQAAGRTGDQTTDVYSLGVIAYELYTGRLPFRADNLLGYIKAHADEKPPVPSLINSAISTDIQKVLLKSLDKDSGKRFRSAGEFARALRQAQERPFRKALNTKRKAVFTIGALMLILIIVVGCGKMLSMVPSVLPRISDMFDRSTEIVETSPVNKLTAIPSTQYSQPSATMPLMNVPNETQNQVAETQNPTVTTSVALSTETSVVDPQNVPQIVVDPGVLIGSGVAVENLGNAPVASGLGRLVVQLQNGLREPVEERYFRIYSQKQDINGNWVTDKSIKSGNTDNAGLVVFDIAPGNYVVTGDFRGYNWGSATDTEGQSNVPVQAGQQTRLSISLGLLQVGFLRGDGSIIDGQYVRIYSQKQDLAGNWVVDDDQASGSTDNSGMINFNLTPGYYIVSSDFRGYNWGNASDVEGVASVALLPGQVTPLIFKLGQLVVGLMKPDGQPLDGQYVRIYQQEKDINNRSTLGEEVTKGSTDNTGQITFNLTPGLYAVMINEAVLFDVPLESGRITFTNGQTF